MRFPGTTRTFATNSKHGKGRKSVCNSNQMIGEALGIATRTVKAYVGMIRVKFGIEAGGAFDVRVRIVYLEAQRRGLIAAPEKERAPHAA